MSKPFGTCNIPVTLCNLQPGHKGDHRRRPDVQVHGGLRQRLLTAANRGEGISLSPAAVRVLSAIMESLLCEESKKVSIKTELQEFESGPINDYET